MSYAEVLVVFLFAFFFLGRFVLGFCLFILNIEEGFVLDVFIFNGFENFRLFDWFMLGGNKDIDIGWLGIVFLFFLLGILFRFVFLGRIFGRKIGFLRFRFFVLFVSLL